MWHMHNPVLDCFIYLRETMNVFLWYAIRIAREEYQFLNTFIGSIFTTIKPIRNMVYQQYILRYGKRNLNLLIQPIMQKVGHSLEGLGNHRLVRSGGKPKKSGRNI